MSARRGSRPNPHPNPNSNPDSHPNQAWQSRAGVMSAIIFAIGAGALLPLLSLLLPGWRALTRSPAHPCTHSSAHPPTLLIFPPLSSNPRPNPSPNPNPNPDPKPNANQARAHGRLGRPLPAAHTMAIAHRRRVASLAAGRGAGRDRACRAETGG